MKILDSICNHVFNSLEEYQKHRFTPTHLIESTRMRINIEINNLEELLWETEKKNDKMS